MLDIIGDVHGRARELRCLLRMLGYDDAGGAFAQAGRQAIFCGDLIDRGPESPAVLRMVRAMVDCGSARVVLGNHEFAAICFQHTNAAGAPLRKREGVAFQRVNETRAQFSTPAEFDGFIEWFRTWPLSLEVEGVRVVHAAWDEASIQRIAGRSLQEDSFLHSACRGGAPERAAVRMLLRGPTLPLPEAHGRGPKKIRCKWWLDGSIPRPYRDWALPMKKNLPPGEVTLSGPGGPLKGYPGRAVPPVFFGHYRLAGEMAPFGNVACLDYTGSIASVITAYRWQGEAQLSAENFVRVPALPVGPPGRRGGEEREAKAR